MVVSWTLLCAALVVTCDAMAIEVTRDPYGDIFTLSNCNNTSCNSDERYAAPVPGQECKCQCSPSYQTFRDDNGVCVKDLAECPLAVYVRPYTTERIPLVSLPMTGQLVYPGAHLTLSGLSHTAIKTYLSCKVHSTEFMAHSGWQKLDEQKVFGIYEDNNQTFLQWLGNDESRRKLQHQLILIRLRCEGEGRTGRAYKPCAALRVGWSPGLEIQKGSKPAKSNNYFIIGLCLGILGLVYVLAFLVYLRIRQSKRLEREMLAANLPISDNTEDEESVIGSVRENGQAYVENGGTHVGISPSSNTRKGFYSFAAKNGSSPPGREGKGNNRPENRIYRSERAVRRNLNIQPELFEPEMLASPPPPAQEFLQMIREMISSARARLKNFRFRPTLVMIPEDDYFYQDFKNQRNRPSTRNGNIPKDKVMESIHGSGIGALITGSNFDASRPPQRRLRTKLKRAPPPPTLAPKQETTDVSELIFSNGAVADVENPAQIKQQQSPTKFDKFRLDLYEKLRNLYDGKPDVNQEIILESTNAEDAAENDEWTGEGCSENQVPGQAVKISRQQVLKRLDEESENVEKLCNQQVTGDADFLQNSVVEDVVIDSVASLAKNSGQKGRAHRKIYPTSSSPYDSLNSLKSGKSRPSCSEMFECQMTKNRCLIRDGELPTTDEEESVYTCASETEFDETIKKSVSCTVDHPSLEEYLQLSNQVAKKLSERRVPDLGCGRKSKTCQEKERNALSQFMKDFRSTLGRFSGHFESFKSKSTPSSSASSDNWTLKREEKKTRTRKASGKKEAATERKSNNKDELDVPPSETFYSEIESSLPSSITDLEMKSVSSFSASPSDRCSTDSNLSVATIIKRPLANGNALRNGDINQSVNSTLERHPSFEEDSLKRPPKPRMDWRNVNGKKKLEKKISVDSLSAYTSDCFSDLTEDSLTLSSFNSENDMPFSYDGDPVMACLNLLANTPLELVIGGRASKGLDVTQQFKTAKWNHVCIDQVQKQMRNGRNGNCTAVNLLNDYASFLENDVINAKSHQLPLSSKTIPVPDWVATSTSEDDETVYKSETSSGADCSSTEGDVQRRKKVYKKHVINGTCKQFIKNRQNGKLSNGLARYMNVSAIRQKGQSSDDDCSQDNDGEDCVGEVTVIQLGDGNVTKVDSGDNFVTLITVDSSDGSNDEEK